MLVLSAGDWCPSCLCCNYFHTNNFDDNDDGVCVCMCLCVCLFKTKAEWSGACTFPLVRFTNQDDLKWFEKTTTRVVTEGLGEEFEEMVAGSSYYMDFMR